MTEDMFCNKKHTKNKQLNVVAIFNNMVTKKEERWRRTKDAQLCGGVGDAVSVVRSTLVHARVTCGVHVLQHDVS